MDTPPYLRPFVLETPDVRRERTGDVDLYLPDADGPRPAVVFVHGGPIPPDREAKPRDWPVFRGQHGFDHLDHTDQSRDAVQAAIAAVHRHLHHGD